ncbi:glycosyltransferase family 9 protein [Psychroflexus aestuariivivens]|uniref:glycosyltransferase family 9 protein n=1 Tax=Psychroflexus aestuariivivens TaxID=1795040 RepID=UPI000FDA9FE8|nr:glycosyltransferase family 9 protein [Psychroflexus aestuariivivens]
MRQPTHILVIRLSAMGDVAMTVPVLERLSATYPNLKITVLTKSFFAQFFGHLENVDVVVADVKLKHKGISGLWRLAKSLQKYNFEGVADLHNVLRSRILCGFLKILGQEYYRIDKGRSEKKALTRPKNKIFKPLKSTHQRYADVFRKMNLPVDLSLEISPQKLELSENLRQDSTLNTQKKWIGIAPFAAHKPKQYPLASMKEVLRNLATYDDYQILLFGGGNKEVKKLKKLSKDFSNFISVAGKFTFKEELQLISNLEVMLAMDSGNGHLAAMFGVEVVTIWGATHPFAGFAPFGQKDSQQILPDLEKYPLLPTSIYGNKQVKSYEHVMKDISPERVLATLNQFIK